MYFVLISQALPLPFAPAIVKLLNARSLEREKKTHYMCVCAHIWKISKPISETHNMNFCPCEGAKPSALILRW